MKSEIDKSIGSWKRKTLGFAKTIGPGVFIIGYIIGTGSVTAMASAGAGYGLSMTWALALSCFFTYIMIVSISRLTIASGQTLIQATRLRFGRVVALLMIAGLMTTVVGSVMGVTAIASDIFREWTRVITPSGEGVHPVVSTIGFISILYYLFWYGKHPFFLKSMAVIVAVMGISFVTSMLLTFPGLGETAAGLVPRMPTGAGAHLILAGLVGTTMASVCLVSRSYLVAEQGWNLSDLTMEKRDAAVSLALTFVISAAIMACAAAVMHPRGIEVRSAIDMVLTLEPLAGRFATTVFVFGILAAALSSLFAGYVLGPWLVCDYLGIPRRMNRTWVRAAVLSVAILGFTVPVFGGQPVIIMIASQAVSPVLMPILVILVFVMLNSRKSVGSYKNSLPLNAGLIVTMVFSLFMSYAGLVGLFGFLSATFGR